MKKQEPADGAARGVTELIRRRRRKPKTWDKAPADEIYDCNPAANGVE